MEETVIDEVVVDENITIRTKMVPVKYVEFYGTEIEINEFIDILDELAVSGLWNTHIIIHDDEIAKRLLDLGMVIHVNEITEKEYAKSTKCTASDFYKLIEKIRCKL